MALLSVLTSFFVRSYPGYLRRALVLPVLIGVISCDSSTVEQPTNGDGTAFSFAAALSTEQYNSLTIDLTGSQVLPASNTRSVARARFVLDEQTLQLHAVLDTGIEDVLSVHIHEGSAGEVGAVVASLQEQANGQFSLPVSTYLTREQSVLFNSGRLYVDLHAVADEVRGQITADAVTTDVLPTLADIQAKIFTPTCSGCHSGGGNTLPGIMDLTHEQASYNSLVGSYSLSVESVLRVEPADPASSLLVHKIQGTHTVGSRMPLRGARLGDQAINAIKQWIAQGARR